MNAKRGYVSEDERYFSASALETILSLWHTRLDSIPFAQRSPEALGAGFIR